MVYLPMLFLSGIFVPLRQLPSTIQHIGSVLPTYHYAQLAWKTIGLNDESTLWRSSGWPAGRSCFSRLRSASTGSTRIRSSASS